MEGEVAREQRRAGRHVGSASRDNDDDIPQLGERIDEVAGERRSPFAFDRRSRFAPTVRGPAQNPFLALAVAPIFIGLAVFALFALPDPVWSVVMCIFFAVSAVLIAALNIARIRPWLRARRVAKEYVKAHGGELPRDLQIWS